MLDRDQLRSLVLWGPPGCGKTTIARALAAHTGHLFLQISAVLDGVKDLRGAIERARTARQVEGRGTILFVDEIHRWNKAQQDALLPHVESGRLVLVGATTENPSYELTKALRSRLQVVRLAPLEPPDVRALLERALTDDEVLAARGVTVAAEVLDAIAQASGGDARQALRDLERLVLTAPGDRPLGLDEARAALGRTHLRHDRDGDDHYNVVSAFIKAMRGSDPDAAVYWLARMIAAGEDPTYIARRMVIFAAEDVGNADPRALQVAVAASHAVHLVGMPEGRIPLAQAATWLATCPKSNASYLAIDRALADVHAHGALPVPRHLRASGGTGYRYPHDHPLRVVRQQYLPDALQGARYYIPADHGVERTIAERLRWWADRLAERDDATPER